MGWSYFNIFNNRTLWSVLTSFEMHIKSSVVNELHIFQLTTLKVPLLFCLKEIQQIYCFSHNHEFLTLRSQHFQKRQGHEFDSLCIRYYWLRLNYFTPIHMIQLPTKIKLLKKLFNFLLFK